MHAGVLKLNELEKVYRKLLLRQPLPGREGFSQRCPSAVRLSLTSEMNWKYSRRLNDRLES